MTEGKKEVINVCVCVCLCPSSDQTSVCCFKHLNRDSSDSNSLGLELKIKQVVTLEASKQNL